MGNRRAAIDWLEDIFIIKKYQGKGIGSLVIKKLEEIVKTYSESLYIVYGNLKLGQAAH